MAFAYGRNVQKLLCSKRNTIIFTALRNHWNKDYKPGAFPVTQEQRDAAALKYGLHPDDYKPFPDDGQGRGDYPDIPVVSADSKDPFYPWDSPELKRNFNEVLSTQFDMVGEDRCDVTKKHQVPVWEQVFQFFAFMFGTFAIYYSLQGVKQFVGLCPKQYPYTGVKHYTFEKP